MTTRAERVAMHRERVDAEMRDAPASEMKGLWGKNRPKQKRKHTPLWVLMVRRIDWINMMARNPGWSL